MMPAHKEQDFIPAIVKIVSNYPDGCNMSQIMSEIPNHIILTDGDKEDLLSRKGEKKYQQIVRNLVSHKNKDFLQQIDIVKIDGKNIFKTKNEIIPSSVPSPTISITTENKLETNSSAVDSSINFLDDYDRYDKKLMEQVSSKNFSGKPKTDATISEYIKNVYEHQCLYTLITKSEQKTFETENGDNYIHAHHLIPMAAWKDFFPKSLDRPSNIVPLAPFYHDILHHGTKEAKEKILRILYDTMNDGLIHDGLYIDFKQLMNYY